MKEYINKLKEIETLVELSIGTTMTEDKATEIYAVTNDLMCKVKKLNIPAVISSVCSCYNVHGEIETKTNYCWYCLKTIKEQTGL